MSEIHNQTPGFIAVRRGKSSLTNCIFLSWHDCRPYLEGDDKVEYSVYDNVHHAIQYLTAPYCSMNSQQNQPIAPKPALLSSHPPLQQQTKQMKEAASKGTNDLMKSCELPSNRNQTQEVFTESRALKKRKDPPNDKTQELSKKDKRKKVPSKPGSRKPSQQWENMFSKFQKMKEQDGDTEVETCGDPELIKWVKEQRASYRSLKEDSGKTGKVITQEKVDRLRGIGFDFHHYTWDDRIRQLKEIQLSRNDIDDLGNFLSEVKPDLAKWFRTQKNNMKLFERGKSSRLSIDQVHQLKSLGLSGLGQKSQNYEIEFQEMFPKLQEYKKDNGDCNVPVTYQKDQKLSRWITKQRLQYKRLKEGKTSQMTPERMIALTDLGFVFVPKGKQPTWESRLQRLVEFKAKHGHLRFPDTDQAMRAWVGRQRAEYRLFQAGRASKMTQEKIDSLNEIGFVWNSQFKLGQIQLPRKTWDERFEELKLFIRMNGHAIVPQATPGLGEWVHTQRTKYKKLQQGKKSSLKPDQALKLVEVGFVFDATNKRGKTSDEVG